MNLEKGKVIFCEEPKKVGIVVNAEENLVRLDGDNEGTTTPVDPEFCHPATAEEIEGTEFANTELAAVAEETNLNEEDADLDN